MGTNHITRSNQATGSADVFSVRESLRHRSSAEACLTGAARVYLQQIAPSIFGFVRNLGDKGSPGSIVNRLGKHAASQALGLQVFDNNRSEVFNQPERKAMLKLIPLIPDSSVNLWKQGNRFVPPVRALLAACNLSLRSTKTGFRLPIESGIRNRRALAEGREIFESHVDSNCVVERGKGLGFAFDREAHVPLAALTLDGNGLTRARYRTRKFDLYFSDALNSKRVACESDSIPVTREGDAIQPTPRLESRKACLLLSLHTKEKRLEGFVYPPKNILAAREVRKTQVAGGSNIFQLVRLVVIVQRLLVTSIRVATFLQRAVVQSAGFAKLSVEYFRLEVCRKSSRGPGFRSFPARYARRERPSLAPRWQVLDSKLNDLRCTLLFTARVV